MFSFTDRRERLESKDENIVNSRIQNAGAGMIVLGIQREFTFFCSFVCNVGKGWLANIIQACTLRLETRQILGTYNDYSWWGYVYGKLLIYRSNSTAIKFRLEKRKLNRTASHTYNNGHEVECWKWKTQWHSTCRTYTIRLAV